MVSDTLPDGRPSPEKFARNLAGECIAVNCRARRAKRYAHAFLNPETGDYYSVGYCSNHGGEQ